MSRVITGYRQNGFTLIEMMVVVVILGIIVSTMVLSIRTDDISEHMEIEMERLYALVNLAQEEAILQGQVLALAIAEDNYRFDIKDIESETWSAMSDDRVFRQRATVPGTHLVLVIDEIEEDRQKQFDLELSTEDTAKQQEEEDDYQRVQIEPSGEIFPFELFMRNEDETIEYRLVMGEDGELKIIPPEEAS
jgi:general secretion pathway protein H